MLGTLSEQQTTSPPSSTYPTHKPSLSPLKSAQHAQEHQLDSLDHNSIWPSTANEAHCILSFVEAIRSHSTDASTLDLSSEQESPRPSTAESLQAALAVYDRFASTTTLTDALKNHIQTLSFESTVEDVNEYRAQLLARFPSLHDLLRSDKEMTVTYSTPPPVTPYTTSLQDAKVARGPSKDRFNAILNESYAPIQQENVPPPNEVTTEASTRFESAFPLDFQDVPLH